MWPDPYHVVRVADMDVTLTTLCYKSVPAKVLPVAHEPTQLSQLTVEVSVIVIITNITTIIMAVIITNIHLHTWLWEGGSAK